MTQTPSDIDAVQALRTRNMLIQDVRTQLKGTGLDIRELGNELVISNPGHADQGRIYITYTSAEVSHRRTIYDYLGRFDSRPATHPNPEPRIDADTIVATLTGQAPT